MAEDYASTCRVKELLDEWDEEATRLEACAYRNRYENEVHLEQAKAEQLRECICELAAVFPDAKAWHEEGVVPDEEADLATVVQDLVTRWRDGKLNGSTAIHELWLWLEGKPSELHGLKALEAARSQGSS